MPGRNPVNRTEAVLGATVWLGEKKMLQSKQIPLRHQGPGSGNCQNQDITHFIQPSIGLGLSPTGNPLSRPGSTPFFKKLS